MANTKKAELAETVNELEKELVSDGITAVIDDTPRANTTPKVTVRIPMPINYGTGMKVDEYEHVTINGKTTYVQRGTPVEVTVPVFEQLRKRYPDL